MGSIGSPERGPPDTVIIDGRNHHKTRKFNVQQRNVEFVLCASDGKVEVHFPSWQSLKPEFKDEANPSVATVVLGIELVGYHNPCPVDVNVTAWMRAIPFEEVEARGGTVAYGYEKDPSGFKGSNATTTTASSRFENPLVDRKSEDSRDDGHTVRCTLKKSSSLSVPTMSALGNVHLSSLSLSSGSKMPPSSSRPSNESSTEGTSLSRGFKKKSDGTKTSSSEGKPEVIWKPEWFGWAPFYANYNMKSLNPHAVIRAAVKRPPLSRNPISTQKDNAISGAPEDKSRGNEELNPQRATEEKKEKGGEKEKEEEEEEGGGEERHLPGSPMHMFALMWIVKSALKEAQTGGARPAEKCHQLLRYFYADGSDEGKIIEAKKVYLEFACSHLSLAFTNVEPPIEERLRTDLVVAISKTLCDRVRKNVKERREKIKATVISPKLEISISSKEGSLGLPKKEKTIIHFTWRVHYMHVPLNSSAARRKLVEGDFSDESTSYESTSSQTDGATA